MKKKIAVVVSVALITLLCFVAIRWLTIETNPDFAVQFGMAAGPGKPVETINTAPTEQDTVVVGDLIPMVFVDGQLYCDIGKESSQTERVDTFDGEITSTVKQSEEPTEDNQSNFGTGYGYQYGPNGTIEILINGKWCVFAIMVDAV